MTHWRYWYLSNKWKPWHMAVSFLSFVLSLILSPSKIKIIIIIIIIITNIIIVVPPTTFFHFSFFFKIQIIVVALKIWSYSWFDLWHNLTLWKKKGFGSVQYHRVQLTSFFSHNFLYHTYFLAFSYCFYLIDEIKSFFFFWTLNFNNPKLLHYVQYHLISIWKRVTH